MFFFSRNNGRKPNIFYMPFMLLNIRTEQEKTVVKHLGFVVPCIFNHSNKRTLPPPHSYGNQRLQRQFDRLLMMDMVMTETCWAVSVRQSNKFYDWLLHLVGCFYLSSKVIRLQAWTDPEGSRRLRFPEGTDYLYPPENISATHFC